MEHQEECLPHLQGDSFTHPQPPYFKEEEEGECPVGQEEADVSKFPLTVVSVKTEEHEDKPPESSQLHHSPNVQQPPHIKEEEEDPQPPHIKEEEKDPQPPHIKEEEEDPQPPHMKEEEEEVWISQEGECPVGQEEADVSKFPLTVVSVKTEEHEDKPPESSQLHHSPNVQQPPHIKEEGEDPQPPHIKEEEEDPQPPHMKEEEEEVWMSQEGECPVGQEEADVSKFPLTVVSVKTEEHEDKPPESSQLHHSPNVQQVSAESHEEIPSKQQEWSSSVGQKKLEPTHIEEEEELWEQLPRLEEVNDEDDIKSEPDSIFAPLSDMDHMMSQSSDHSDHIQ
ncbi:uncharacterized protein LOC133547090 isoform X3 [Nerophis ophidion]|uniref:uncharacterized protein LOC133547090 isoform X3 n=1 Tax=Nerophis ophidion TaxID=159077 RepID=UPI002AE06DB9|nr:uncharacterized protein LOC133547090 isoform X3 [Nerophis ophidion]